MGRFISQDVRERVWELWGEGRSGRAIARQLGTSAPFVRDWIGLTGGVRPPARRRSAGCLTKAEREEISRGLARGDTFRAIGRAISRPHTTVSREVDRNGGREHYRARSADEAAWARARRPKPSKLRLNSRLRAIVEEKLALRWSPQQISGWLLRIYPDDSAMQVSHETIYLSLFVQSRGALRRELCAHLRSGRRVRRPKKRTTRYCQLIALPDGLNAEPVRTALAANIGALPEQLRRSLTWDQGKEMAEHVQFTVDSGVQVYFCDPRSPWQRGSSENTNGLLRQYFPKGSDLTAVSQAEFDRVAAELNGRPRQTLGWMTPAERLAELLNTPSPS